MSSSSRTRIIKSGASHPATVQSYSFGTILAPAAEPPEREFDPSSAGFVPFALVGTPPTAAGAPSAVPENELPAVIPDMEGMIVFTEDELQMKVDEVYRNGMEEGRRQAERGLANVFKSLREGVSALTGVRQRLLKESEEDLLRLAIMIARKIVQREIAQDQQVLASLIATALGGCAERDRVVVRLNPDDYAQVSANRQAYLSGLGEDSQVTLTPDDNVGPGGCLVETVTGTVDARIESQIDEIYRVLLEERSAPAEAPAPVPALPEPEHHGELPVVVGEEAIPPFVGQGAWVKAAEEKNNVDG